MAKNHKPSTKLALARYKEEMAKEMGKDKLNSGTYTGDTKITKPNNLADPTLGRDIGGHVKQMIGEYEREASLRQAGDYVRQD